MVPIKRPASHPSHDGVARELLLAMRADISKGAAPGFEGREMWQLTFEPKAKGWQTAWGARAVGLYKRALVGDEGLKARGKCVWCEQLRSWRSIELVVDHFRPKGEVSVWGGDPDELDGRPPKETWINERGYWWLACAWSNWNLACSDCNSIWKRRLLPRVGPSLPHSEGVEASEVLLLLDPTSDFQTRDHFAWDEAGYMFGQSEVGRTTIITCGLNRDLLVEARHKRIEGIELAIEAYSSALANGSTYAFEVAAGKLAELGSARSEFAGMVRHFSEERIGEPWESLPLR